MVHLSIGLNGCMAGAAGVWQESLLPNEIAALLAPLELYVRSKSIFSSPTSLLLHHRQHPYPVVAVSEVMDLYPRPLLNSTSSLWTEENTCSSTLRARLRDDDTPVTSSSTKPAPYRDVYQQVQACLGSHFLAPKPDQKKAQTPETLEPAIQLRGQSPLQIPKNTNADIK